MNTVLTQLSAASWLLEDHATQRDGVWIVHGAPESTVSYPDGFRSTLAEREDKSLWFYSRNVLIHRLFQRYASGTGVLEVGAGNGAVSSFLSKRGTDAVAIEPGIRGAQLAAARGVDVVIAGHLEDLALPSESVTTVGLFDVIEHLDDPSELLQEVHRVLVRGGSVLVTVPAFPSLWSQADDHAGHYRRYRRRTLRDAMSECGLDHRFSSHCFAGAVPLLFAMRTLPYRRGQRLSPADLEDSLVRELSARGPLARWLGAATNRLESAWMRVAPVPFGTSIIGVFCKDLVS